MRRTARLALPLLILLAFAACGDDPTTRRAGSDGEQTNNGATDNNADNNADNNTADPCAPNPCAEPDRTRCAVVDSDAVCGCDEGTVDVQGSCLSQTDACEANSCNLHGDCGDATGALSCLCAEGYDGERCEQCASGFHDGGEGGCTTDPCAPNPCFGDHQTVCSTATGQPVCQCDPGFHAEGAHCVEDTGCLETTCNGHGVCSADDAGPSCACDLGFTGDFCGRCDDGFHDDGLGGCTTDACLPNPCRDLHRAVCADADGGASCACDDGYHLDADACVADELCRADTCLGRGTCRLTDGRALCTCDDGFTGDRCEACDGGAGYHADGDGGCTTDACVPNPCTELNRAVCDASSGAPVCACDPGTHDEGGACVVDLTCLATTCNGHGDCDDTSGQIACACLTGFAGPRCGLCDADHGFHSDGQGGCTDDPCVPNLCAAAHRRLCTPTSNSYVCDCDDGYHLDGDACALNEVCTAATCRGHGDCTADNGVTVCACRPGYTGDDCGACDADNGYHADGLGGCTNDACLPNPCTTARRTVCTADGADALCSCDAGFHDEAGACVVDATCGANSCNADGDCDDTGGQIACACFEGWTGARCDACDAAGGYHADGLGGCSNDACLPNPCTTPLQTVCFDNGTTTECRCDDGAHDDGTGVCTTDVCRPNPCAASNMACRDAGGLAECYAPQCDLSNPCRVPEVVNGQCVYTVLSGGESCSTSACLTGQTCVAGQCSAGVIRDCADANPCTRDTCDDLTGCVRTPDAALIPDDGLACTLDACSATGVASHLPDDGVCDDGLFCTGVETCAPGVGADADGCVVSAVPAPPVSTSPCVGFSTCREAEPHFEAQLRPVGAGCDDTIGCTSGDACRADGVCAGQPIADCPGGACMTVSELGDLLNVPVATVFGTVTFGGQPTPSTSSDADTAWLYLVAHDTGVWHELHSLEFSYVNGNTYRLQTWTPPEFSTRVVPGVYDVLYVRGTYSGRITQTRDDDGFVNGQRILRRDVVIGPGDNPLDLDVPRATVSGTVKFDGVAAPGTSSDADTARVYLIAQDTGAWHEVHSLEFAYVNGNTYRLQTWTPPEFETQIMPGVYDVMYDRGISSERITQTRDDDGYVNGRRLLQRGLVVQPGANALTIDIARATVSGTVKFDGVAAPGTSSDADTARVYLIAQDTGTWHEVHSLEFAYVNGNTYRLQTWTPPEFETQIMPGVYDVMYDRGIYSERITQTRDDDGYVNGRRTLQRGLVVQPGANALTIDIARATVAGTVKFDGQVAPGTSSDADTARVYLIAQDTGAWHEVHSLEFAYVNGNTYRLQTWTPPEFETQIMPGVYDVMYDRGIYSERITQTRDDDGYVNGRRILQRGLVVQPGANALTIDIARATVAGTVRIDGQTAPGTSSDADTARVYLIAEDTGTWHEVHSLEFAYVNGNTYRLQTWTPPEFETQIMPGVYDVMYDRGIYSGRITQTRDDDGYINGRRILQRGFVVQPGANALAVELRASVVAGQIAFDGVPAPSTSSDADTAWFHLVARDTGTWHELHSLEFAYVNGNTYRLQTWTPPEFATRMMPGQYDLLFYRGLYNGRVTQTRDDDGYVNGQRLLDRCVEIP